MLNSTNHNCLYYLFNSKTSDTSDVALYFIAMQIYIESGMPFIVAYTMEMMLMVMWFWRSDMRMF